MNYLAEIVAFERRIEVETLSGYSQLIWYRLMSLSNKSYWAEWVTVDNPRLMSLSGIKSKSTFLRARDELIDFGLIDYRRGKKGRPNQYRMISLVDHGQESFGTNMDRNNVNGVYLDRNMEPNTVPNVEPNTVPNVEPIYKQNKYKQNKTKESARDTSNQEFKSRYGRFNHVLLSDRDMQLLKAEYGQAANRMINNLDCYLEQHPEKLKKYESHYATMVKWADEDAAKKQQGPAGKQGLSVHAQDGDPDTQRRVELLDEIERQQVDAVMNFGEELHET